MKKSDLVVEVGALINAKLEAGLVINTAWLIQEIVMNHSRIYGEDKDFYVHLAYDALPNVVRHVLKRVDGNPEEELLQPQGTFPGFPRLLRGYRVQRGKDRVIVPLQLMSVEELLEKAGEYDEMAEGCREHAEQLRRFASLLKDFKRA